MSAEQKEIKSISIKIEKDMWVFLKNTCIVRETNLTSIVNKLLDKYRKNIESRLSESK
jgi:hypothetical protein